MKKMRKTLKRGGQCGCTKLFGGKRSNSKRSTGKRRMKKTMHKKRMTGGFVDFASFPSSPPSSVLPSSAYYPYNELAGGPSDPTSANMQPSTRLFPDMVSTGGKRRTRRRRRH